MRKDIIHGKLPDPFIMNDGSRVENITDWRLRRREILEQAIEMEFGGMPPAPENIRVEPLDLHGTEFTNTYRIHCGTKEYPLGHCSLARSKKGSSYICKGRYLNIQVFSQLLVCHGVCGAHATAAY